MKYKRPFKWCLNALAVAAATATFTVNASDSNIDVNDAIRTAVDSELRTAANMARDTYRHPAETLAFLGVEKGDQVVEIWPGRGWYSEILAGTVGSEGKLFAAHFAIDTEIKYFQRSRAAFIEMTSAKPELYQSVELTEFYPPTGVSAGPDEKVDKVLTFRNVHNWMKAGYADKAFTDFFQLLKPGGTLGVVEHRAKPGTSLEAMIKSGYVTEAKVIELATNAGFVLDAKSEVNANAKDSTNHPKGVWTLPPSLRLGEEKREHYLAIGESDRMTLRFNKPK